MEAKPRLVELTMDDANLVLSAVERGDLSYPHLHRSTTPGRWFADADELRRWRASQHTSGVSDGT